MKLPLLPELEICDLLALLNSRLCHDLISPIGAINNGLELLADDASYQEEALSLIRLSSDYACAHLRFARLAYGAAGGLSGELAFADIKESADDYLSRDKWQLIWQPGPSSLSKLETKLLLNLLLIAKASLIRGGSITIGWHSAREQAYPNDHANNNAPIPAISEAGAGHDFILSAQGPNARLFSAFAALQNGEVKAQDINVHNIQSYYSLFLAQKLQRAIIVEELAPPNALADDVNILQFSSVKIAP